MTTATAAAFDIELDAPLKDRIRQLAERRGESPGQIVRAALEHLERAERERREEDEAFYQEALEAEREFHENGLHLTGREVIDWLLNTKPGTPPPPCRQ